MLSERIEKVLSVTGMGKLELANALGVSSGNITHWINGTAKSVKPEHLFRMEDLSGLSARWIALGEGPMWVKDSLGLNHINPKAFALIESLSLLDDSLLGHMLETVELISRAERKESN